MMKCDNCGAEVPDDSIFCNICGRPVGEITQSDDFEYGIFFEDKASEDTSAESGNKNKSHGKRNIFLILSAVIILVLLVGGMLLYISGISDSARDKYEKSVYMTDKELTGKNYGEAKKYYDQALEYLSEIEDASENERYELLYRGLKISDGMGDEDRSLEIIESLLEIALTQGYLSDQRDYYSRLLDTYDRRGDTAELKMLIETINDSGEEKLMGLLDKFRPNAPVFGEVSENPRPSDKVSVFCDESDLLCYSSSETEPVLERSVGASYDEFELMAGENAVYTYCINEYGLSSRVAVFRYYLSTVYQVPMPVVYPDSGEYNQAFSITVDVPEGLTAYYSWNSSPENNGVKYIAPVYALEGNNVFNVIYVDEYGNRSNVQRVNYIYLNDDMADERDEEEGNDDA